MKILYFDCSKGASGDMILGSLIDSGILKFEELKKELEKLSLKNFKITKNKVNRSSIKATKFNVLSNHSHKHCEKLKDILSIIDRSKLNYKVKENSKKIFVTLAEAEAKVHGVDTNKIHFHEVGDIDSIVDIVGIASALELIKPDACFTSAISVGRGIVETKHGILPSPGPATLELLKGRTISISNINHELTTPTAGAIFKAFFKESEFIPNMKVEHVGYGAGDADFKGVSNVLRVVAGNSQEPVRSEYVLLIEVNIDDMAPLAYESIYEKLFSIGALDVYITQIMMKKMRPAVKLSVISYESDLEEIAKILLKETTTLGIRFSRLERVVLKRKPLKVKTKFGLINAKLSHGFGNIEKITPEYRDCLEASKKFKIPFIEAYAKISDEIKDKYGY